MQFEHLTLSFTFFNTVIAFLKAEQNKSYVEYIFRLLNVILKTDLDITNEFLEQYAALCSTYCKDVEYMAILEKLVVKYDQFESKQILICAVEMFSAEDQEIHLAWCNILLLLSNRNINFTSNQISILIDSAFKNQSAIIFDVLFNVINGLDTVPEEIRGKLEDMIGAKDHQEKTLKIIQAITNAGYTLHEESI